MKVIVTRAGEDADSFAALCRQSGLTPLLAPVMRIDIEKATIDLSGIGALAFTSANGVRAFVANSDARDLLVFAVGPVTAEAAKAAGFQNVRVAGGDVERLTDCIVTERGSFQSALLHVAGAVRAGDLIAALRTHKIEARRLSLYQAHALDGFPAEVIADLKNDPAPEWASFFSPRTASLFLDLARKAGLEDRLATIRAACLSEAVAEAARASRWRSVHVAQQLDAASMVELILSRGAARA